MSLMVFIYPQYFSWPIEGTMFGLEMYVGIHTGENTLHSTQKNCLSGTLRKYSQLNL